MVAVPAALALLLLAAGAAVPNLPFAPGLEDPDSTLRALLDPAGEANLWTWFNVALLLLAATAHAVTASLRRAAGLRAGPWWVLAVVLAALSLDDLASLHERLDPVGRELGAGEGWLRAAWVVPGALAAVLVVAAVWRVARLLRGRSRWLLVAGLGTFLGAALGLEVLAFAVLDDGGQGPLYAAVTYLEELLEAWGAVALLASPVLGWRLASQPVGVGLSLDPRVHPAPRPGADVGVSRSTR
ncbi:hypothetical protein GCM10027194_19070 [Thalassiella azotivora]